MITSYRGYNIHIRTLYAFIYHQGDLIHSIRGGTQQDAERVVDDWLKGDDGR